MEQMGRPIIQGLFFQSRGVWGYIGNLVGVGETHRHCIVSYNSNFLSF